MEVIGTSIAVVQLAYFAACTAVDGFETALKYFDDAEALCVSLELERIRLQTWGTNAGLADGSLEDTLSAIGTLLLRELNAIKVLFADADKLRDRYGVPTEIIANSDPGALPGLIRRMRRSLRSSGVKLYTAPDAAQTQLDGALAELKSPSASRDISKRIRWVIRDKDQLNELLLSLTAKIDLLNKLLTERRQRQSRNDNERIKIVVVGSAVDEESLALVRAAVDNSHDTATLASVDRKRLVGNEKRPMLGVTPAPKSLRLADYNLPEGFAKLYRFTVSRRDDLSTKYLMERKPFDSDIDEASKTLLFRRVQRLQCLLAMPTSVSFRVPHSVGYIHDPSRHCWWLVFELDQTAKGARKHDELPNLRELLKPDLKQRPALEARHLLAFEISRTFHQLYSSSWMHKSIRSSNIVFNTQSISEPLVCGFDYSRLETEAQTIDKSRSNGDIHFAMYRHPNYQGEAAQGYKIQYDIYSLGLVLFEIGLWAPLTSLFDSKSQNRTSSFPGLALRIDATGFHAAEAKELGRRVLHTNQKDMAFRMGSAYAALVEWCLTYDEGRNLGQDGPSDPAVDFFNHVVEPLGFIANST